MTFSESSAVSSNEENFKPIETLINNAQAIIEAENGHSQASRSKLSKASKSAPYDVSKHKHYFIRKQ